MHPAGTATASSASPADNLVEEDPRPRAGTRDVLARGVETAALVTLLLVVAFGVVGLLLAMGGIFQPLVAVPLAGLVFAGLCVLIRPLRARAAGCTNVTAALAVAFAITFGGVNAHYSSEHLFTDRDPAIYVVNGRSLASHGELPLPSHVPEEADGRLGRAATGNAVAPIGETGSFLQTGFAHLLPVYLAGAHWLGGDTLMLSLPAAMAALALLLFFLLAARFVRPWLALAAMVVLGTNLVQTHLARDAYSEIPAQLLLLGGLWLLWGGRDALDPRWALVAGLVAGASIMSRVDGFVYLIPFAAYGGVELVVAQRRARQERHRVMRFVATLAAGLVATSSIGYFDLRYRSPHYFQRFEDDVRGMTLLSIAIITAGIVAAAVVRWLGMSRVRRLWTWVGRRAAWFAGAAGAAVGVLAVWAWFIRPSAQATTTNNEFVQAWIAAHQERQGLPIEPARTYYESSLRWIGYYFGPVVVGAAVAGWAILAVRIARRRWLQALPFLFCFSAITGLYLWDPSIAPDHAWAMRRFLPLTLPGFVLLAVVAVDRVFDLDISPRVRNAGRAAAVLVVGAALAFSIRTQLGVFTERTQDGMLGATQGLCDELGNRAAVLSLGGPGMHQYVAAVRSFCDVPVVTLPPESERGTVGEIARAWAARGRRLYVVDTDADSVRAAVPPGVDITDFTVTGAHFLEERLQGRPTELVEESFTVAVAPTLPATAG